MNDILDTVLLLALPASGKSEVRRYLELMPADARSRDFHMGPSVQLDDFPYVHMMRRIDDELAALGQPTVFFRSTQDPFTDPRDWGTLTDMINQDHEDLLAGRRRHPTAAARDLFERLDRASAATGAPERLGRLDASIRTQLADRLEGEARRLLTDLQAGFPDALEGKTLVIEFARGGPDGSSLPLPSPHGYRHSLGLLSPEILAKAVILYIWVTPEESRRKNAARANPDDPGSILHHGVPRSVLLREYGIDDMEWLTANSERPGCVTVQAHGRTYHLPVARFDNRVDKTSFLRADQAAWEPGQVKAVHDGLRDALDRIAGAVQSV